MFCHLREGAVTPELWDQKVEQYKYDWTERRRLLAMRQAEAEEAARQQQEQMMQRAGGAQRQSFVAIQPRSSFLGPLGGGGSRRSHFGGGYSLVGGDVPLMISVSAPRGSIAQRRSV